MNIKISNINFNKQSNSQTSNINELMHIHCSKIMLVNKENLQPKLESQLNFQKSSLYEIIKFLFLQTKSASFISKVHCVVNSANLQIKVKKINANSQEYQLFVFRKLKKSKQDY